MPPKIMSAVLGLRFRKGRITCPQIVPVHLAHPTAREIKQAPQDRWRWRRAATFLAARRATGEIPIPAPSNLRTVEQSAIGSAAARLVNVAL